MVPWLETQEKEIVAKDDIESLIYLFEYLSNVDGIDNTKIGMGGICTGASMVALAASDHRINENVAFLNLFAGYYDAFDFMKSVASEQRFYNQRFQGWKPDHLTKKVVFKQLIEFTIIYHLLLSHELKESLLFSIHRDIRRGCKRHVV